MSVAQADNPYRHLPAYTRWSKAIAGRHYSEVDPVVDFSFKIDRVSKVATAGSCFAQHIARHLKKSGFSYFVAEDAHPFIGTDSNICSDFNYGTFSARFGNVYSAKQLLQLFDRAFGNFTPVEGFWRDHSGNIVDPFRPMIQPNGFCSEKEMLLDRVQHLGAVRKMFREADVFVFTMGLTEYWYCRSDGAALPLCPGVVAGAFDDTVYGFHNQTASDVMRDMNEFLDKLALVNPAIKIILTVSPVPLAATAEKRNVLVSTTYSKSVLRVAAGMLSDERANVEYFPSYEIITGSFNRGRYFDDGLRDVTEEGVEHVMRLFMEHVAEAQSANLGLVVDQSDSQAMYGRLKQIVETVCEEAAIEQSLRLGVG